MIPPALIEHVAKKLHGQMSADSDQYYLLDHEDNNSWWRDAAICALEACPELVALIEAAMNPQQNMVGRDDRLNNAASAFADTTLAKTEPKP